MTRSSTSVHATPTQHPSTMPPSPYYNFYAMSIHHIGILPGTTTSPSRNTTTSTASSYHHEHTPPIPTSHFPPPPPSTTFHLTSSHNASLPQSLPIHPSYTPPTLDPCIIRRNTQYLQNRHVDHTQREKLPCACLGSNKRQLEMVG